MATVGGASLVPVLGGAWVPHVNLDHAASTPAMLAVRDAVDRFLPWYSSVHRGAGYKAQVSTAAYEDARHAVGSFVGARPDDAVVFTRNTTDALNLLASCLTPPGPTVEVITFDTDHHANLLPWRRGRVRHLSTPRTPAGVLDALAEALGDDGRLRLVSIPAASNVTGEVWPVADIAALCHRRGARLCVDAAQLAAHGPIDMAAWDVDYLALSGHKLYAPYGSGALIGRPDWLAEGEPYLRGGGAVRFVTADGVAWADLPDRQEAGSPNVVGAVAMAAACRALQDIGLDHVAEHEVALLGRLEGALAGVRGVTTYRLWPEHPSRIGLVTFNVEGLHHGLVAAALAAEYGISVRDGCFCAHPLMLRLLDVDDAEAERFRRAISCGEAAQLPGAVRASLGVDSTTDDVDRLAAALRALATDGPRWTYRWSDEDEGWSPDPDDRPLVAEWRTWARQPA